MTFLPGRLTTPSDFDALWHFNGNFTSAVGGPAWSWLDPKADQGGALGTGGFIDMWPGYPGFSGWPGHDLEQIKITGQDAFNITGDITIGALVLCPPDTKTYYDQYENLLAIQTWAWGVELRSVQAVGAGIQVYWRQHNGTDGGFQHIALPAYFAAGSPAFIVVSRSGNDITSWVNKLNRGTVTVDPAVPLPGSPTALNSGGVYLDEGTTARAEMFVKLAAVDDAQVEEWTSQVLGADFARAA